MTEKPRFQKEVEEILTTNPIEAITHKDIKSRAVRFIEEEIVKAKEIEKQNTKPIRLYDPVSQAVTNFEYIENLRTNQYVLAMIESKGGIIMGNGFMDDSLWLNKDRLEFYIGAGMGRGRSMSAFNQEQLYDEYITNPDARKKIERWAKQKKSNIVISLKHKI